jgi:hypothetical protein
MAVVVEGTFVQRHRHCAATGGQDRSRCRGLPRPRVADGDLALACNSSAELVYRRALPTATRRFHTDLNFKTRWVRGRREETSAALSSVRDHHHVLRAGGHMHDIGRRGQLLRRGSLCGIAQAQPSVHVVTRRPRLHSHTASERTHRTATSAVQVQCEQCKSSAASGRYQPRARNADDHNGAGQALFLSPRQTLPRTPASTREAKSTTNEASPRTQAPLAQATDKTSRMHAPTRLHPEAPCVHHRRPPARCCSARAAAPACFDLWYRPGPAVRIRSNPSPTPALSHSERAQHNAPHRQQCKKVQCEQCKSSQVQLAGAISRERATQMITTVRCKLSSQARDRLSHASTVYHAQSKQHHKRSQSHTHRHHSLGLAGTVDKSKYGARTRPLPSTSTVWALPAATCTILVGEGSCTGVVRCVVSPRPSCPRLLPPVAHACALTQQANAHAPHRDVSNASAVRAMQVKCS